MSRINLHHLHAFGIVAATGGIRRSADMLFRASSAVARSVTALEESLGTQLFERKGSGMLLTAAGQIVQLRVQRIETELKEVRDDAVRLAARDGALIGSTDALFQVGGTVGALIVGFYMDRLTPNRVIATAYIGGAVFILMLASGSVTSSLFAA